MEVQNDVAGLFSSQTRGKLWMELSINRYTVAILPFVLVLEVVLLYALKLKSGTMALVGGALCFTSLMFIAYAWSLGKELSAMSAELRRMNAADKRARADEHVGYANAMAITLLMGVVAIECAIRMEGGLWGPAWLLTIHFLFVGASVLSYVIARFVLTGLANPVRHKVWVRVFTSTYIVTLVTGTSLLLIKFPLS